MTKKLRLILCLWCVMAACVGSPQRGWGDALVTLKGETEVRRLAVRLSDVFTGIPAESDADIAQAPAPGKQMTYDVNVLKRLAQKYHLDWQPVSLADRVVVTSATTRISTDEIREAIVQKVKDTGVKGEIDVSFDNRQLEINLPADRAPHFSVNNFDYDPVGKRFRADVVVPSANGPLSVIASGRISVKRNIPVLAKHLDGGTTISASDIDWIEVSEDRLNGSVITSAEQLIGRELRRETDQDEIIRTHDIIPPRLVTRGTLVTMKIETPVMMVTAQGKALQDGTQGETIRVQNTQSNRMVEGTVVGPGLVVINTTQKFAAIE